MLSKKFGPGKVNYFAGSPVNRVSFLRSNNAFLKLAVKHPSARFILLQDLDPLSASEKQLAYVTYSDVEEYISGVFELDDDTAAEKFDSEKEYPLVVFLGVNDEAADAVKENDEFVFEAFKGRPYFAVDVTANETNKDKVESVLKKIKDEHPDWVFKKTRLDLKLVNEQAAILAQARSFIHWNGVNRFCSACGRRTFSTHAGGKRVCPSVDKGQKTPPCTVREGIHNIAFPRTDPTVIMAILNSAGDRILLGRQKKWPKYWYSCLAGFLEPGESIHEAVARETWEESGVIVKNSVVHSSQPWPYPSNLMIGCIGEASSDGEKINLKNDPELESAKWFTFDEVRQALKMTTGSLTDPAPEGYKEGDLRLPPGTAIANQLLVAVVHDQYHLSSSSKI